jgi:hypothetical protein
MADRVLNYDETATGDEDRFNAAVYAVSRRLDRNRQEDLPSSVCFCIAAEHASEGVRTNGHADLSTAKDALDRLGEHYRDIDVALLQLRRYRGSLSKEFRTLHKRFERLFLVCTACEGKKGRMLEPERSRTWWEWQDCNPCQGRGFIKRNPDRVVGRCRRRKASV